MVQHLGFLTTITFYLQISAAREGLNEWCGPYETFCLFSEKKKFRVSDLSEAQFKCSETKDDSWPVELGDERAKELFLEFIHNYSISNVILNAINRNGNWYWKRSNSSVGAELFQHLTSQDNILFYKNSSSHSPYDVVCMTSCRARWYDAQDSFCEGQNVTFKPGVSFEKCKELCEVSQDCSSIDWAQDEECRMHVYPYDATKLKPKNGTSHYFIDRSVKRLEVCIGLLSVPFPSYTGEGERRYVSKKPSDLIVALELTLMLILLLILLTISVAVGLMLWRRRRKRMKVKTVVRKLKRQSTDFVKKQKQSIKKVKKIPSQIKN